MSSRLPIGVATTNSVPGIDRAAYCTIDGSQWPEAGREPAAGPFRL
jgi:hypothetical protein